MKTWLLSTSPVTNRVQKEGHSLKGRQIFQRRILQTSDLIYNNKCMILLQFKFFVFFLFQPIDAKDDAFWDQFWSESVQNVQDVFTLIPAAEIRALREESPNNLATLCYKAVEKLVKAADTICNTAVQQQTGDLKKKKFKNTLSTSAR